jgi:hypothetical protein
MADHETTTTKGEWVASIPVYLTDRERRALRLIAARGSYQPGAGVLDLPR